MNTFDTSEKVSELIQTEIQDLLAQNISAITTELYDNPDGKLAVSMSIQLKAVKERVFATTKLSYSRKFGDEVEGSIAIPDPNQPTLNLDKSVVESAKDFRDICEKHGATLEIKTGKDQPTDA